MTVDLTAVSDWILVDVSDLVGSADLTDLKAIFFTGDSGTTVSGLKNDRFSIDNLIVQVVPEPGTALLLGMGLSGFAVVSRRRIRA